MVWPDVISCYMYYYYYRPGYESVQTLRQSPNLPPNPVMPITDMDSIFPPSNHSSRPNSMHIESSVHTAGERPASTHGSPTQSELTELPLPIANMNSTRGPPPPSVTMDEFSNRTKLVLSIKVAHLPCNNTL